MCNFFFFFFFLNRVSVRYTTFKRVIYFRPSVSTLNTRFFRTSAARRIVAVRFSPIFFSRKHNYNNTDKYRRQSLRTFRLRLIVDECGSCSEIVSCLTVTFRGSFTTRLCTFEIVFCNISKTSTLFIWFQMRFTRISIVETNKPRVEKSDRTLEKRFFKSILRTIVY